jgi:transcription termination/antitermination protein NusG
MNYYALQVETNGESDFVERINRLVRQEEYQFFLPKRTLTIKRRGKLVNLNMPVFSGYVFLGCEDCPTPIRHLIRATDGFYRFLPDNRTIRPLSDQDLRLLKHFMSFGEIADKSKVSFDENDRILVHEGPLKGYEGYIVKVDKRKGRAKLRLSFCQGPITLDFGFELIEKLPEGAVVKDGRVEPEQDLHNRGGVRGDDISQRDKA